MPETCQITTPSTIVIELTHQDMNTTNIQISTRTSGFKFHEHK